MLACLLAGRQPLAMDSSEQEPEPDSRRAAIIGLLVIAVLVVAGYFVVTALQSKSRLEDCLMAGRKNCAPVEVPAQR
jgi:hypothetical protein